MLYPPDGGKKVAYSRPSTMAKWMDSKEGLVNWKASQAMVGLMMSKSLQARVSAIIARTKNDYYRENKDALKSLVETATQIAQASARADLGTAFHEFAELLDAGFLDWNLVPEGLRGPLEAYRDTTGVMTPLDSEVFVAIDEVSNPDLPPRLQKNIRGAGSLDRVYSHPDLGVVVGDLKTGSDEPRYPLGVTTQVAIYSRGSRYRDAEFPGVPGFDDGEPNLDGTAWRKPIHPNLNPDVGILVHCPLEKVGNRYECALYPLDLKKGWESLLLGHRVQASRRMKELQRL